MKTITMKIKDVDVNVTIEDADIALFLQKQIESAEKRLAELKVQTADKTAETMGKKAKAKLEKAETILPNYAYTDIKTTSRTETFSAYMTRMGVTAVNSAHQVYNKCQATAEDMKFCGITNPQHIIDRILVKFQKSKVDYLSHIIAYMFPSEEELQSEDTNDVVTTD